MGQVARLSSSRHELVAIRLVSWSSHALNRLPGVSSVVVQLTPLMSVSYVGEELTSLMAVSWFACLTHSSDGGELFLSQLTTI